MAGYSDSLANYAAKTKFFLEPNPLIHPKRKDITGR